jgi:glycosyltransferase involved in cell wall biosynthesis
MRIALAGPAQLAPLHSWLDLPPAHGRLPRGGTNTSVTLLARGLLDRGHDVVLVTLDRSILGEVVLDGSALRVRIGPYRSRRRARDAFRAERVYLAGALRREAPDLVHAHWTYEYALGALCTGLPTLVSVRDWAPIGLRLHPQPYRVMKVLMHARTLTRGEHFTVTSPIMQQRVGRWLRREVPIIPNAVSDEMFDATERRLDTAAPTILAVNNGAGPRKNIAVLLQAFRLVRDWNPACHLRLVGEGYGPGGPAHRWAVTRDLSSGVEFDGSVPHERVPALMRQADLFVHPSLEESFGIVLIEAMGQGLPVIAGARSGAIPWVLDGGRAGVLTDVTSPRLLADAIVSVLSDGEAWVQYSRKGFAHAWQHFRLSSVVDDYLQMYDRVLEGTRV